jgi:hypothetical protein
LFRIFGFTAVFVFAASAELFGLAAGDAAPDGLLVVAAVPVTAVERAEFVPLVGVDVVGGAAGSVVNGVGCGGNGLVITLAIRSVSPTSDWL